MPSGIRLGAVVALTGALAVAGCSDPAPPKPPSCAGGFLGSASRDPDFEFVVVGADYNAAPLKDGDTVPLLLPLQGGRVVFVGARATNIDGCGVQLTGALRDETTRQVRFDQRTVNLEPSGDGWGATGAIGSAVSGIVSNFANIPACPNQWSTEDVNDREYALEVTLKDRGGRTVTKAIHVTPVCAEPENAAECACICRAGYVLGSTCDADAASNADAASSPDGASDAGSAE
jgi:hypothetical protein